MDPTDNSDSHGDRDRRVRIGDAERVTLLIGFARRGLGWDGVAACDERRIV